MSRTMPPSAHFSTMLVMLDFIRCPWRHGCCICCCCTCAWRLMLILLLLLLLLLPLLLLLQFLLC